ncbi:MAG: hypothetical protein CO064_09080 [Anaerolineae bacterium CG_4_9_14_0_8_um_filter_58_9]|nr:MAG: hypothetical protein CO064_09080 [Anaerolineae bacterium CG_4_9_14_0_8_um_filter_58_9]
MDALKRHPGAILYLEEMQGVVNQHSPQGYGFCHGDMDLNRGALHGRKGGHLHRSKGGGQAGRIGVGVAGGEIKHIARQAGPSPGKFVDLGQGPRVGILTDSQFEHRLACVQVRTGRPVRLVLLLQNNQFGARI